MSWTLPSRCPVVAETLEKRASLFGASLKVNAPSAPEAAPAAPDPAPAPAEKN
jgi:hypothetical protein